MKLAGKKYRYCYHFKAGAEVIANYVESRVKKKVVIEIVENF